MKTDPRKLCTALMRADTEDEVVALLQQAGVWDDPACWRPVGDKENNFSTIGNQQSEAIAALVEKVVNGVDARLINAALESGIDPAGAAAPSSMRAAVARFFEGRTGDDDRAGRISEWSNAEATEQGRLLTVAATGHMPQAGQPSISIADQGEGQTPDSFPTTFMSLQESNKLRIPFVQGKFNMGGTGALQFCGGAHKLQLVVSRRNPALLGTDATARDRMWGFTVVRRMPPSAGSKSSVFTYLVTVAIPGEGRLGVPAFSADEWPIFPEASGDVRDAYARTSPYGSLVKLYEYEWQGVKSNIVSSGGGLLRRIDLGLPELALPVRLFECRAGYRGHVGSFATNALGLVARLDRDKASNLEEESPIGGVITLDGRQIKLRVYVFRPDAKASDYRSNRYGVVFAVNGQTHGAYTADFFRRKAVGLGYLADSLLVVADCTAIDGQMREDLFMNSRDRLRDTPTSRDLEVALERFLKHEPTLRDLQYLRRKAALEERLEDDKPLAEMLKDLLKKNPTLSRLFLIGARIPAPDPRGGGTRTGASASFEGKRYPTYFRFKGKGDAEPLHRDASLGSRARVAFETDAEDSYFVREDDAGAWNVRRIVDSSSVDETRWTTTGPKSGVSQLWLDELPDDAAVGDQLEYLIEVTDPSRVDAFVNRLIIDVRPPAERGGGGGGTRTPSGNRDGNDASGGSLLALPQVTRVYRDKWTEHNFNDVSALRIISAGDANTEGDPDAYDFFVNVDNKYLVAAKKETKGETAVVEHKFIYGLVLIGLALIQDDRARRQLQRRVDDDEAKAPAIEDVVRIVSSAVAPVLLPILETLGGLSLDET